jgi:hypothetical protein
VVPAWWTPREKDEAAAAAEDHEATDRPEDDPQEAA